ncbi:MAG: NAD-dependent epimerase/dehydratase family protein [Vicinamibacterales bacterium]
MRILFTGTSSFTGAWFIRELVARGHEVVAVTRGRREGYSSLRQARIDRLTTGARIEWACATGTTEFEEVVDRHSPFDALGLHGAEVGDYRRADFDYMAATTSNTSGLTGALTSLARRGCPVAVLTGTVFEAYEGAGEAPLRAFSGYGLSKTLTAVIVEHACHLAGMRFAKFVIPNPFGPMEEPRFIRYLANAWLTGQTPEVRTPDYVRDNIHVSLLAASYASFLEAVHARRTSRVGPAGYIETQGAFARRVAEALSPRLGVPCPVRLARQTQFDEPRMRVNTEPATALVPDWDEDAAWQSLADFYLAMHRGAS